MKRWKFQDFKDVFFSEDDVPLFISGWCFSGCPEQLFLVVQGADVCGAVPTLREP